MQWQEEKILSLEEENKNLRQRLAIAEGCITRSDIIIQRLNENIVDLKSRSMRDNIVIKNIDESQHETPDDIEKKVIQVFKDVLKIPAEDITKINIERIHRIGKQMAGRKRHIVAKLNGKGKNVVMRNIKNVAKGSYIRITVQLLSETHINRDKLWPIFIDAKRNG